MLHRRRNRDLRWFDDHEKGQHNYNNNNNSSKKTNGFRSISEGDAEANLVSTLSHAFEHYNSNEDYCTNARKFYSSNNRRNVRLATDGAKAHIVSDQQQNSPLLPRKQQQQRNLGNFSFDSGDNNKRPPMHLHTVLRIASWHVLLYCFVILYILAGASVFHYLEGEHEIERHLEQSRLIQRHKAALIDHVQHDAHNRRLIEEHLRRFLENISRISTLDNYLLFDNVGLVGGSGTIALSNHDEDRSTVPKRWTFESSVLFAFTILTTIGYGNVAPTTTICQVFTMVYGAFGIPLFLITLADVGRFFKTFIVFIIQRAYGKELKKQDAERKLLREIGEVILVAILFLTFIAIGSAVLPLWEHDLTYFDSVYFSYMSLTTIGLGDIVPRRMDFLLPTLLYITIGLWLTTAMVEQLADVFRLVHYAGRHVSNVKSIKVWLGGHQVSVGSLIQTICRRVGMSDNISGRINWDRTIEKVLNGEPPPLVPIFPWHFADFLEHDPPLIDEDYYDYEYDDPTTRLMAARNGNVRHVAAQSRPATAPPQQSNRTAIMNRLRLSPPKFNGFLRHTVSVVPPPVARDGSADPSPFLWRNRCNFSAPALDQICAQTAQKLDTSLTQTMQR